MKTKILIGCVALQFLILAVMAGQRELIRLTGRTVYFRTAPVDPRDVMRGDYVRLMYDISHVPREKWRSPLTPPNTNLTVLRRDTPVYASLTVDDKGVARLESVGLDRPRAGLFIRGRTETASAEQIDVRYGLEALFLEQGRGTELETGRNRDGIQVPLEVKAAVGPSGIAVLQDHRWCDLGLGMSLELTNVPGTNRQPLRQLVGATLQLLNASSNEVAIVDLPRGHSFRLVPDRTWNENPWYWSQQGQPGANPETTNVVVLKPGQIHSIHLYLNDPWWSVSKTGKPGETRRLTELSQDWSARFRFEYCPPERSVTEHLPNGNLLWHGHLTSRAFSPGGTTD